MKLPKVFGGFFLAGLLSGVVFWIADSAIDALLFGRGDFTAELFTDEPREIWIRFLALALFTLTGAVSQSYANVRRRAAEEMRLAASVFASASDGVAIIDKRHKVAAVNPAFERVTGFGREAVLGKDVDFFLSAEQDADALETVWQEVDSQGFWEGEVRDRRASGEIYVKWLYLTRVRGDDGNPLNDIAIFRDITEVKRQEEELRYMAHYDALTGLPNRVLLLDRMSSALEAARRKGTNLALIFLDLDQFKDVNDAMGHDVGDRLLEAVGARLRTAVRKSDTVARLAGDEFVLLLEDLATKELVVDIASKVKTLFGEPFRLADQDLYTTVSMGVSLFPVDGTEPEELLKNADTAMYHAKNAGRDRYLFYSNSMNEISRRRLRLMSDLKHAVERGQLKVVYQPQYGLATGEIVGLEALTRWAHPSRGIVKPEEFIPLAETSGFMGAIGDWIFHEVCRQLRSWEQDGITVPHVSINLTARQLRQHDLAQRLLAVLAKFEVQTQSVCLEIDEAALLHSDPLIKLTMQRLSDAGISFALDDFGTGYSSLVTLKRFPISRVKVDNSFVQDLPDDGNSAAIVVSIIALSHSLGIRVTAEGVEDEAQLAFLKAHDCDAAQGFYLSELLSGDSVPDRLQPRLL